MFSVSYSKALLQITQCSMNSYDKPSEDKYLSNIDEDMLKSIIHSWVIPTNWCKVQKWSRKSNFTPIVSALYFYTLHPTKMVWLLLRFFSGFASSSNLIVLFFNIASSAHVTLLFCEKKNFYYNLVHQNETSLLKLEHFYDERMVCKWNF